MSNQSVADQLSFLYKLSSTPPTAAYFKDNGIEISPQMLKYLSNLVSEFNSKKTLYQNQFPAEYLQALTSVISEIMTTGKLEYNVPGNNDEQDRFADLEDMNSEEDTESEEPEPVPVKKATNHSVRSGAGRGRKPGSTNANKPSVSKPTRKRKAKAQVESNEEVVEEPAVDDNVE